MGLEPRRSAESRMTICGLQTTLTLRLSEAGYGNRREDSLHRAGQPTGEWLYRVIHRRLRG